MDVHARPCENPSKLVVPIIVHSSATVPGTMSRPGTPVSGGRVCRAALPPHRGQPREEAEVDRERVGVRVHGSMP